MHLPAESMAIYGPVTVFGLSPEEGSVSLLPEQVTYVPPYNDTDYRVTMDYRVCVDGQASFLLPGTGSINVSSRKF